MTRRHYFSTHLDADLLAWLRELSAETRVPQAAIVRDVLRAGLPDWERDHTTRSINLLEPQDLDD